MNVKDGGPAIVTAVALNGGGAGVYRDQRITFEEVNQAIKRLENGMAAGIDGITAEMLKCGGDIVRDGPKATSLGGGGYE